MGHFSKGIFVLSILTMVFMVGNIHAQPGKTGFAPAEGVVELNSYDRIFMGWVDLHEEHWNIHGYGSPAEWAAAIGRLNDGFQTVFKKKQPPQKEISGAAHKNDNGYKGKDLYLYFYDARIDYDKYHLYLAVDFVDVKTNKIIYTMPQEKYRGKAWGFENYLAAALKTINKRIKKVLQTQAVSLSSSLPGFRPGERKAESAAVSKGKFAGYKDIYLGWVDMHPQDWSIHEYASKTDWLNAIDRLNKAFQSQCRFKYLPDHKITGATSSNDRGPAGKGLFIKLNDVRIHYKKYKLYLSIEFIDAKTGEVLHTVPRKDYYGSAWGFENYLKAALDKVNEEIRDIIFDRN